MPLETATYVSDLVTSNPAASDPMANADDHLRLLKATLKATFHNFTSAPLNSTQAQIDAVAALLVGGVIRANGAVPPGFIGDFGGTTAPAGWLECNGAAVSRTTYADLFAAIGTTWGAGDGSTTFNLPPDRYRVGRNSAAAAVGTLQASQNKAHTHPLSGALTAGTLGTSSAGDHFHAASIADSGHTHPFTAYQIGASGGQGIGTGGVATQITVASSNTQGAFTGVRVTSTNGIDTTYSAGTHSHSVTGAPGVGTLATVSDGGTDARPLTLVTLTCIKT